jgi:prophage regulatory protein
MDRILRMREVMAVTGLSRSTIWRQVRARKFPPPMELSDNAIGWSESVIQKHRDSRKLRTYGAPVTGQSAAA